MASNDIETLLTQILTAIYGKDVRQTIHDAIRQCYLDGKAGGNDLEARERAKAAEERMDTFTSLTNGSTTGDAELADIRIGMDGTTYGSAGTAVREQVRNVKVIEVGNTAPTKDNVVLWLNIEEDNPIAVLKVKNSLGSWVGVPAIQGQSVYELAVEHGYIGTEDEFVEELISDGWVGAALQLTADIETLEQSKVARSEIYAKEQIISNETKNALSLSPDATPDDAFFVLSLGSGKYGYKIHLELDDGTPVVGAVITGIDPVGIAASIVTDENGNAVGSSTNPAVTISVASPYVDIADIGNYQIASIGIVTNINMTMERKETHTLLTTSGDYKLSPLAKTVDFCLVGGGGGGVYTGAQRYNGAGGGGGYVVNFTGLSAESYRNFTVVIGAGGIADAYKDDATGPAGDGGMTMVSSESGAQLIANGGGGAQRYNSAGIGNGNGGAQSSPGEDATGYIFNKEELGLAGGGGGGGDNGSGTAAGGQPQGNSGIPGGGGSGRGGTGGCGGLYVLAHYTDEEAA